MAERSGSVAQLALWKLALYGFGIFNWFLYLGLAISSGSFFKKETEKDRLQLAIAKDKFWNLSKCPIPQFSHQFYRLRNGLNLHYITNAPRHEEGVKNLAILIHGYPDSCIIYRHMLQTASGKNITDNSIVVCVDLPGYGGSDSFKRYGADEVLEALTEFVIGMRTLYGSEDEEIGDLSKTYIISHDWGAVIAYRLAAEAPALADRFIITNGPHVELALANRDRMISSAAKIFKQFRQSPRKNFACLNKTYQALQPLLKQMLLFGYIAVFQLPAFMVKYLGTGGNHAFLRGAHKIAYGSKDSKEYNVQESLASTFGPGAQECKSWTQTPLGKKSQVIPFFKIGVWQVPVMDQTAFNTSSYREGYGPSVLARSDPGEAFMHQTAYYRDGAAMEPWNKSLQTTADLFNLEQNRTYDSGIRRRSSSASSMFGDMYKGSLHAPVTILWGSRDLACSFAICLDGIGDYLARDSDVILLPRTNHWTIVEGESRRALARLLEIFVNQKPGSGNVSLGNAEEAVKQVYEGATVLTRK